VKTCSPVVLDFINSHGFSEEIAEMVGFAADGDAVTFRYEDEDGEYFRRRQLPGEKTIQPKGRKLSLWTPLPIDGALLVLEGESDLLAATDALYGMVDIAEEGAEPTWALKRHQQLPPPVHNLVPVSIPGVGNCHDQVVALAEKHAADVVIAFDGDGPGRANAEKLAKKITASDSSITAEIVSLPDGKDLSDVLAAADLENRIEVLANFVAEAYAALEDPPSTDVEADQQQAKEDAPDPLPPPVITGLLDEVLAFVDRYVVLPGDHERFAQALWVAHTYAFDGAHATPYLLVLSAEKRSGKTRDLEALGLLVAKPWPVIGASEAAIFRKIDRDRPTMLFDEVDALWGSNTERTEPLRAVLNAGNRPGAAVARCTGEGGSTVEDFGIYCPKALFGIDNGRIPDTQRDRSIVIRMVRKTNAEPVERFRHRVADKEAQLLRRELAGWAAGAAVDLLLQAEPDLPLDLDDRAAEAWEPLLAIADMAGGDWPAKARSAALALSGDVDRDEVTIGALLLGAIRDAFGEVDRITTIELLAKINADEELPFGGWSDGNGLDGRRLAKLLKPYKVKPRSIRLDDEVAKGYLRSQFEEVWERWLPLPAGTVTTVTSVTGPDEVTAGTALEVGCNPVTLVTPETDGVGEVTDGDLEAEAERLAEKFGVQV
jgi:uncharacterized protein DUF3631/Toprim domain-containing protein